MQDNTPEKVQNIIDKYFNLILNGKKIRCPYYINTRTLRMGLRVLIGKGLPDEIIQESLIYEKLRGVNFTNMSEEQIREFLVKRHIGIDCSGFIVHILNTWVKQKGKKSLWKYLQFPKQSIYRKFAILFRPVENISAEMLTNETNTHQVRNLDNIKVGDLIRLKGLSKNSYHVMLIANVNRSNGKVRSFEYVHATRLYNKEHGVRRGEVVIKDPSQPLSKQTWTDNFEGKVWTYEEVLNDPKYAQVRRLRNVPL